MSYNSYTFADDGLTLNNLQMNAVSISASAIKEILNSICYNYGIKFSR